jgi:hypothetical protein
MQDIDLVEALDHVFGPENVFVMADTDEGRDDTLDDEDVEDDEDLSDLDEDEDEEDEEDEPTGTEIEREPTNDVD